ncbi:hypothetical protein ACFLXC_01985 [Chloroflexota bacterium]
MSKKVVWHCDNTDCNAQEQAWELPAEWLSLVFINIGKEYRYCFCTYRCLIDWAVKRDEHYKANLANNRLAQIQTYGGGKK